MVISARILIVYLNNYKKDHQKLKNDKISMFVLLFLSTGLVMLSALPVESYESQQAQKWYEYNHPQQSSIILSTKNQHPYHHSVQHADAEVEDRPRIRLNFGIHVPAMRIQMPRFQLPRITIRAKIRPPDSPPTIRLPAIHFDTSSKISAPNMDAHGGHAGSVDHRYPDGSTCKLFTRS